MLASTPRTAAALLASSNPLRGKGLGSTGGFTANTVTVRYGNSRNLIARVPRCYRTHAQVAPLAGVFLLAGKRFPLHQVIHCWVSAWECKDTQVKVTLITQPYSESVSLYQILQQAASDPAVSQLDIVVAWARRSGLGPLRESILSMKRRNAKVRIIVGVDAGGASRQGLTLTQELATEAYVVHTPGSRTFHPKLYVIRAASATHVVIGSQNLTRGGVLENFEVGALIELIPNCLDDRAFLQEVDNYIDELLADFDTCKRLSPELLAHLLGPDAGILISDEDDQGWSPWPTIRQQGEDATFGRSRRVLTSMPSTAIEVPESSDESDCQSATEDVALEQDYIRYRWYKKVKRADAQRLPGSNPSGHMTLTQSRHPIDAATYFRQVFFDTADWQHEVGRQYAMVEFRVEVLGQDLGLHQLRIDHRPAFESGQGNRTSTLRWGDYLGLLLRSEVDITGYFAVIERTRSGQFRLIISTHEPLPFI